ncbi:MAG: cation:proton antiporter [Phycisphaerales bacterium]|jgi:CPA1 family monovalent cation:H+ antiporter|nr:cation:proton antiporter [Phycisphaerales bacterium]
MDAFTILTLVVVFTAVAAWANDRFLHLPSAIGVMIAGLLIAGGTIWAHTLGWVDDARAVELVNALHFDTLLVAGYGSGAAGQGILLGLLLFAAALQLEPASMTRRIGFIIWLATIGVVLTAVGTALGFQFLLELGGHPTTFLNLLIFGAILAPTDPVAALSLLRRTSAPVRVREVITGESLFNDGVSIILFLLLLAISSGSAESPWEGRWGLGFLVETGGALVVGFVIGLIGKALVSTARQVSVIVLVTMAIVLSIGVVSPLFHVSCPVTCVVAGLVIGRSPALRQREGEQASSFWGIIEQSLTAILFLMIGLELLAVNLSWSAVFWSMAVIPILLAARFVSLAIPWAAARMIGRTTVSLEEIVLMTWCGLRGGVSIAMCIALPGTIIVSEDGDSLRSHALVATIVVVIGSILIQGLTVERLARFVQRRTDRRAARLAEQAKPDEAAA